MKNTKFMLADETTILELLDGSSIDEYETLDASMFKNQTYVKKIVGAFPKLDSLLIRNKFICIVYASQIERQGEVTFDDSLLNYETLAIKVCTLYDKDLNFVKKGTLENIAKYLGIVNDTEYIDVGDIGSKPKLFMQICKASGQILPQAIADKVLQDCKNGAKYAQFLVKPKNPIEIICKKEGITRAQLAQNLGVSTAVIENALSRGVCSKNVIAKLKAVYKYV